METCKIQREDKKKKVVPELRKPVSFYKIVLIFNSINTKPLFRHRPSVRDAHRGWLLEVAWRRDGLQQGFLPTASNTASKVSMASNPPHAQRLKRQKRWRKRMKIGAGEKDSHVSSYATSTHCGWGGGQLSPCLPRDRRDRPEDAL